METDLIRLIDWLPQTKLRPPQLRGDTIIRTKLLDTLEQAITGHPLTLVMAPAGYGKTTLLAALPVAFPRLPVAWLALDRHDNDPIHLAMGLAGALRSLAGECCESVLRQFHAGDRPASLDLTVQAQRLIGLIVNEIINNAFAPFVLILDDYHLLTDPAAHASVDYLLERLPARMHLVINSRRTPPLALARLQARSRLAEFRLTDLAFSLQETTAFLNEQLGLALPAADLARLHQYTEGWPAGLRLLGSSLEGLAGPVERRAEVTRLVQAGGRRSHIFDYLAQEVFSRQPATVQEFLLKSSILPELTPALCQAVTGWSDAPAMLADLYYRNLFLVNVSQERRHVIAPPNKRADSGYRSLRSTLAVDQSAAYRFHDLFADFLHHRLALTWPDVIPELHRRAAEATADPNRKIDHYLAARMWEPAARMIAQIGEPLLHQGLQSTLTGWLEALPEPTRRQNPKLLHLLGVCAWHRKAFGAACTLLEQALAGYNAAGNQTGQGQTLVNLAACALFQADFSRLEQLIEQGVTYPITPADRVQLLMSRVWLHFHQNAWLQAEQGFTDVIEMAVQANERRAWRMLTLYLSPALAALENGLAQLESICQYAHNVSPPPDSFWQIAIDWQVAYSHYRRGRFDRAGQLAEELLARGQSLGDTYLPYQTDMFFLLAGAQAAYGHYPQADIYFDRLFSQAGLTPMAQPVMIGYLYGRGRAYCQQGRLAEARQVLGQMSDLNERLYFPAGAVLLPLLQGLLALAEQKYEAAEAQLQEAIRQEPEQRVSTLFGSSRLMLAHLYLTWGRPEQALAALAPVLAECEQQEIPGLILAEGPVMVPLLKLAAKRGVHAPFAARVLELFGVTDVRRTVPVPDTGEILTSREIEVLELITAGATNRQIAARLDISPITVKSHVTRLLRKLDVTSRTQAAARAGELGIVKDGGQP